ncbi:MAG: hypothetical protein PUB21_09660 [Bacteroidales bacterium]|nr:hypothetical protein [Bacteroidales bacterium]
MARKHVAYSSAADIRILAGITDFRNAEKAVFRGTEGKEGGAFFKGFPCYAVIEGTSKRPVFAGIAGYMQADGGKGIVGDGVVARECGVDSARAVGIEGGEGRGEVVFVYASESAEELQVAEGMGVAELAKVKGHIVFFDVGEGEAVVSEPAGERFEYAYGGKGEGSVFPPSEARSGYCGIDGDEVHPVYALFHIVLEFGGVLYGQLLCIRSGDIYEREGCEYRVGKYLFHFRLFQWKSLL